MARVTVEDCILRIPNRFELVLMAAQRARNIASGAPLTLDRDNDKNPVVSLRELAEQTINLAHLEDALIQGQQKYFAREEADEDLPEFDALEGELEASARLASETLETAAGHAEAAGASPEDQGEGESQGEDGGAGTASLEELAEREAEADAEIDAGEEEN